MTSTFKTISPVNGTVYIERPWAQIADVESTYQRAKVAQIAWRDLPVTKRVEAIASFVNRVLAHPSRWAEELCWQIGRPIAHGQGELNGFAERARYMLSIAPDVLAPTLIEQGDQFERSIVRQAIGVVLVLAPWNYPMLTAVNAVVPALLAGNAVILKHSDQTPLVAERLVEAGHEAGLPQGLFQYLHLSHEHIASMIADGYCDGISFTGSISGGRAVSQAAAQRFIPLGLELGGKDAAYLREDANIERSAATIADGAFFNAGQSCCSIERVYVHESCYDRFVEAFIAEVNRLKLGDPRSADSTLGPVARQSIVDTIKRQISGALNGGAQQLIDPSRFPATELGRQYLAPSVMINVDHSHEVMREESFGPVVGVMSVTSDEQAISLVNDSRYGLTAALFTDNNIVARQIADHLNVGTVFMNRCDYLDPALPWVGTKDSGRGCTLSQFGFDSFTRHRSFHFKKTWNEQR